MPCPPCIRRVAFFTLLFLSPAFRAFADEAPATPAGSIAAELQPFVDGHTLAGAVLLVADKDQILTTETVGFADIAGQQPMQADSLFWIASMSKPITAAAFMILVDEGKVQLDDPIIKYLPEFKEQWLAVEQDATHILLKKPEVAVTIRHVLSHTSGMTFKSLLEQPTLDRTSIRDNVLSYALTPLQAEPGTRYQYSNAGINTAGRIIEVVSGMPYEEFLQTRLFTPLDMHDTTFWPSAEQLPRLAKSYKPNADKTNLEETTVSQLIYPLSNRARQPMPGGGLFSTASDLANFCRMILNGGELAGRRYLSPEAVREMTTNQTGDLAAYGLGWSVPKTGSGPFGHGGAYSTNMTIDPQKQLVFIYMVQHAGYANADGGNIQPAFVKAATARFAK